MLSAHPGETGGPSNEFTVFVVDDDDADREYLIELVRGDGFRCVGYRSAAAFLDQAAAARRGCLVTDLRMPKIDGIDLVLALRARGYAMPAVVVTGHADVRLAVRAMQAGACDLVEKPMEPSALLPVLRRCLEAARAADQQQKDVETIKGRLQTLSGRERQVLDLISEGLSSKQVALQLNISPRTVEIYRANLLKKMQARRLADLVKMLMMGEPRRLGPSPAPSADGARATARPG